MTETKYSAAGIAENRANWIAYLREPGRKKAVGHLADIDDHESRCCLGHYCAVMGVPPEETKIYKHEGKSRKAIEFDGSERYLPMRLAASLNITCKGEFRSEILFNGASMRSISQVNDWANLNMAGIADVIEQQFAAENFKPTYP